MGRFATAVVLLLSLLQPAWAAPDMVSGYVRARRNSAVSSLTLSDVVHSSGRSIGRIVEWRGMVDGVALSGQGLAFTLRIGTQTATVNVASGSFSMADGAPVGVLAKVVQTGSTPTLALIAAAPAALVGLGGEMPMESHVAYNGSWPAWIRSFNRGLSWETASSYASTITRLARGCAVDPRLVLAVVAAESAFSANAVSPAGAMGLGQLMPDTAASLGVRDVWNPNDNLDGAVRLLHRHLLHYGDLTRVLAAYNAGPGAVDQYGGVPPYDETRAYVRYVLALYHELGGK